MVTKNPISETIPPGPDVVQLEIDPDLVTTLSKHLNSEVQQSEVVPTLVIPEIFVTIETPILHRPSPKIQFGPDGKVLPLG